MTVFLYCFYQYLKTRSWNYFFLSVFLGGVVIEFKVYAGALILGGLVVVAVWEALFKRNFQLLMHTFLTLLLAVGIYLPNSLNSQDFLVWQPWWFIRTMVLAPDRLNWLDLELRRQTYIADHNWKRVAYVESIAFFIFLVGNLGMRVIGFLAFAKFIKGIFKGDTFSLFFVSVTTASFLVPVLFVQQGVAWNAVQFNQYFLLLFGFLAAITLVDVVKRLPTVSLRVAVVALVIILAIPTQVGLLWDFYSNAPLSKITDEQLQSLEYLKTHTDENAVILTSPMRGYFKYDFKTAPVPIQVWYETGYVSAFSGRRTLLADEEQVDIMGYNAKDFFKERDMLFHEVDGNKMNTDPLVFKAFVSKYHPDYLYLSYKEDLAAPKETLGLTLVYQSPNVRIYKIP